jgi:membrane protease YdiL (CAAX protease family)
MSIIGPVTLLAAAATTRASPATAPAGFTTDWAQLGQVIPMAAGALLLAAWAGVFRKRSIVGPPRLAPGEPLGTLLIAMLLAFVVWVTLPSWYMLRSQGGAEPATAPTNQQITPGLLQATVLASSAALVLMLAANAILRINGLKLLGLHPSRLLPGIAMGILGALILLGLVFLASALTELLWQVIQYEHPREHELLRVLQERKGDRGTSLLLLISAWLVAPLFEEIFFRGHLQTLIVYAVHLAMNRRLPAVRGFDVILPGSEIPAGTIASPNESTDAQSPSAAARWAGVIVASILFAAVHAAWSAPPIFVLSLCVGYAYERTGNLWTPIVMHAAFNITNTLIFLRFAT